MKPAKSALQSTSWLGMQMRSAEFVEADGYNSSRPGWRGMPRPTRWRQKREPAGGGRSAEEERRAHTRPGPQGTSQRRRQFVAAQRARATGPALAAWAAIDLDRSHRRLPHVLFEETSADTGFSSDEEGFSFLSDDETALEDLERGRAALMAWHEGQARRAGGGQKAAARGGAAAVRRSAAVAAVRVSQERVSARARTVRMVHRGRGFPAAPNQERFRAERDPTPALAGDIAGTPSPQPGGGGVPHGSPTRTPQGRATPSRRSANLSTAMTRSTLHGRLATRGDVRPSCANCGKPSAHDAHYCTGRAGLGQDGPRTAARKERYRRRERAWLAAEAKVTAAAAEKATEAAAQAAAADARAAEAAAMDEQPSDVWLLWQALVGRPLEQVWEKLRLADVEKRLQLWLGEAHDAWRATLERRRAFREAKAQLRSSGSGRSAGGGGGGKKPPPLAPSAEDDKAPGGALRWLVREEEGKRRTFPLVTHTVLSAPPPWPASTVGDEVFKLDQCLGAAVALTEAVEETACVEQTEETVIAAAAPPTATEERLEPPRAAAPAAPVPPSVVTPTRLTIDLPMQRLLSRLSRDTQWGSRAPRPAATHPGWYDRHGGWVGSKRFLHQ